MKDTIHTALANVCMNFPDMKFYIFGSQAHGTATPESDLDLCVIIPDGNEDPFEIAYQIRVEIRKYIRIALDVLVVKKKDFESRKNLFGTIEHTVALEGIALS